MYKHIMRSFVSGIQDSHFVELGVLLYYEECSQWPEWCPDYSRNHRVPHEMQCPDYSRNYTVPLWNTVSWLFKESQCHHELQCPGYSRNHSAAMESNVLIIQGLLSLLFLDCTVDNFIQRMLHPIRWSTDTLSFGEATSVNNHWKLSPYAALHCNHLDSKLTSLKKLL